MNRRNARAGFAGQPKRGARRWFFLSPSMAARHRSEAGMFQVHVLAVLRSMLYFVPSATPSHAIASHTSHQWHMMVCVTRWPVAGW